MLNIHLLGTFPREAHIELNNPFIDKILELLLINKILPCTEITVDENMSADASYLAVGFRFNSSNNIYLIL
jgi:hypothetical protein